MRPRRSANFRTAMKRSAERRRCPKCDRKSATFTLRYDDGVATGCRWCDYQKWVEFEL